VGTHFAGVGWQGVPNSNNGLYQTNTGPAKGTWDAPGGTQSGSFGYGDIETHYLGTYTGFWHADAEVPWLYNPTTGVMISYEDPQSLSLVARFPELAKSDLKPIKRPLGESGLWEESVYTGSGKRSWSAKLRDGTKIQLDDIDQAGVVVDTKMRGIGLGREKGEPAPKDRLTSTQLLIGIDFVHFSDFKGVIQEGSPSFAVSN